MLVACEYSGRVRDAFIAQGHEAMSCDIVTVPGFDGYLVSKSGAIYSNRTARGRRGVYKPMSPSPDKKGYLGLTLCGDGYLRKKCRVHRIVAEAFIPNLFNLPCVRHLDGNPANNSVDNLAWGSYADNEEDKRIHGTWDLRRTGKLCIDERNAIRDLISRGARPAQVASMFCVHPRTVARLVQGKIWSSDPCEF